MSLFQSKAEWLKQNLTLKETWSYTTAVSFLRISFGSSELLGVLNQFIVQLKLKANKASMPISFQSYSAVYEKQKINKSLIFVIKRSRMLDEWEANGWWILSRKHFLLTGSPFFLISHFLLYFHTSYSKILWNTKRKIWLLVSRWEILQEPWNLKHWTIIHRCAFSILEIIL